MLTNYVRSLRALNPSVLRYLFATAAIGFAIDGGVYGVLFNLYLIRLGFGPEFIGQVNSAGLTAFALSSLPAGAIGARFGNRLLMLIGIGMMVVGGVALPLAEALPLGSQQAAIITAYVLVYSGLAIFFVNAVPFVMEISSGEERNQAFSLQTALLALAAFTGALIGGTLPRLFAFLLGVSQEGPAPYRLPLILAALLMLPSIWIIARIRRPPLPASDDPTTLIDPAGVVEPAAVITDAIPPSPVAPRWRLNSPVFVIFLLLCAVRFFQVSGVAAAGTFFNVYMDTELDVATANIGLITAFARLLGVPAALMTPALVMRWGAPWTVVIASTVAAFSMLPLALLPFWPAAAIGFIGVTAISSMRYPAYMIYAMGVMPPSWRGTLAGAGETAGGISFAGLALLGGYMIANQGYTPVFLLAGGLTLIGTLLFYLWFVAPRRKPLPMPARMQ